MVITGESQRGNSTPVPSRLAADEVNGEFGAGSELTVMNGTGHASILETTATGAKQTANGDRLEAHFAQPDKNGDRGQEARDQNRFSRPFSMAM